MKHIKLFEEFLTEGNSEVELVLSKDENFERVKQLLRIGTKAQGLNFTRWEYGMPLGSNKGRLVSMYFANDKKDIESFITGNSIKVANISNFNI